MKNRGKDIEQLFHERFMDFRVEASSGVWRKISSKLAWQNFIRFNLNCFNIYYVLGIIALGVAGVIILFDFPMEIEKQGMVINNNFVLQSGSDSKISNGSWEVEQQNSLGKIEMEGDKKAKSQSEAAGSEEIHITEEKKSKKRIEDADDEANTVQKIIHSNESSLIKNPKTGVILEEKRTEIQLSALIAEFSMSRSSGCVSLPVEFTNHSENAITCLWHFGDGCSSIEKDPGYIYDEPGEYKVTLEITDSRGEKAICFQTVNVFPKPEAQFEIYPENLVLPNDPANFYNYSKNAVKYEWEFGDLKSSDEMEPIHYYKRFDNYDVKLKVLSDMGCIDSLIVFNAFANSANMIDFPNAFTPNLNGPGSGYYVPGVPNNDVFHPVYKGIIEYQLKIFNKRGQLIFESIDINIGWDGYYKGKLAEQNVYIWKASGMFTNGKLFIKAGDITLLH